MVVDDEDLMRRVTASMIIENGGRVISAVDGLDAVERFAENFSKVDYICMDLCMPGMSGYEAFLEIKKIAPSAKVIMLSGKKLSPEVENLYRQGEVDFLSKPYHETSLISAIKRLEQK